MKNVFKFIAWSYPIATSLLLRVWGAYVFQRLGGLNAFTKKWEIVPATSMDEWFRPFPQIGTAVTSKPCTLEVRCGHEFESHAVILCIPGWFGLWFYVLCSFLIWKLNRHYMGRLVDCLGFYSNFHRRCTVLMLSAWERRPANWHPVTFAFIEKTI